jgi:energy-coupling factor transporter ATP-binding protein EcfA2
MFSFNSADLLNNYVTPTEISPELKKEDELTNNDRMYLVNKKLDDNFLNEMYTSIIDKNKYIIDNNLSNVNEYVYNDVEFLSDHYMNEDKSIFNKLNKTHTKIGGLLLKKILLNPTHDAVILKNRQEIIKKVSAFKGQLLPLLEKIQNIEHDVMWFYNDKNLKHIEYMNDLIYFNYDFIPFFNLNDILNNNERALLVTNIYKIIIAPALTILTPIISLLIPLILLFYFQRKTGMNISFTTVFSQYIKTLFSSDSMKMIFKNPTKAMLASFVTKGLYIFMYFQNIYYSVNSASNTNKVINIIHDKLNKVSQYISLCNKITEICKENNVNDVLSYIHYSTISEDLDIYIKHFDFPIFNKDPSLFSNKGKILYTFKKIKESKNKLSQIFHYTGIIDTILSIENLLSNSNDNNPYCLTQYSSNSKTPIIDVNGIWHPYLDNSSIVKNNLNMKSNILITGPNAAGKSTFIKSIILNILMSQTIGISSAKKFTMTPFHMIESYLHISDSKGSSSLFEAEMFRSRDYIEKIKNMDSDKFSFIVLDEIFSSTNYVEGFSGAYSILKKISSFDNTLSITTTHYTDLERLEKDTKGKITNYKFDVEYNDSGEIIFNYLLKKGISRQYIALELLKKNGFDDDVINDAMNICKKLKNKKLLFSKKNKSKKVKE